jgi:hypothetical protein
MLIIRFGQKQGRGKNDPNCDLGPAAQEWSDLEELRTKHSQSRCWSGLLDACLERAGLREDKDLHSEAWVLVTRATDTL